MQKDSNFVIWVLLIVLGAAINTPLQVTFIDNYITTTTPVRGNQTSSTITPEQEEAVISKAQLEALGHFALLATWLILMLMVPVAISVILSKAHPDKRIVPPLFMQLITFSIIVLYTLPHWRPEQIPIALTMSGMFSLGIAFVQDAAAKKLVGMPSDIEDDVLPYSYRVAVPLKDVYEKIFQKERYRGMFLLGKAENDIKREDQWILRSRAKYQTSIIIQLLKEDADKTLINLVFYRKGRYWLERSIPLEEAAKMRTAYLKDLAKPTIGKDLEPLDASNASDLVLQVKEDQLGYLDKVKERPVQGWKGICRQPRIS